jgi:hypothetical protein
MNQNESELQWSEMKTVLTSAPHEGFGMTTRYALCNEALVVAKKS